MRPFIGYSHELRIRNARTATDLDSLVDDLLAHCGMQGLAPGESYADAAWRMMTVSPDAARAALAAATRIYEITLDNAP